MIIRGSIHIPIDNPDKVASALNVIGKSPSLATWIDLALAFNAYHGIDEDTFCGHEVVQMGKAVDTTCMRPACEPMEPDVVIEGNLESYLRDNVLT